MLADLLDRLEARYGALAAAGPDEPYRLLIWLNCGYPASDAACAKGFASLQAAIGLAPAAILGANEAALAEALRPGGMVPELRAQRLKTIAARAGELDNLLGAIEDSRRGLTSFATIGEAAADRILLFCGLALLAVAPSGALHVPLRLGYGTEHKDWGKTYASVRDSLAAELPMDFQARQRAYLLLKAHGQATCKATRPRCADCPLTAACGYFQAVAAPAALSPG